LNQINKHIRQGIKRLHVDEELKQRLATRDKDEDSAMKIHNEKMRSLSRLKELPENEQRAKYRELNSMLKMPKISGRGKCEREAQHSSEGFALGRAGQENIRMQVKKVSESSERSEKKLSDESQPTT
jgi:hypothetical protein